MRNEIIACECTSISSNKNVMKQRVGHMLLFLNKLTLDLASMVWNWLSGTCLDELATNLQGMILHMDGCEVPLYVTIFSCMRCTEVTTSNVDTLADLHTWSDLIHMSILSLE